MKIFYRWLRKKLYENDGLESVKLSSVSEADEDISPTKDTYRFSLHRAEGGWILQYTNYDDKRDCLDRKTYIITDGQDLGESISKILTIELLRK